MGWPLPGISIRTGFGIGRPRGADSGNAAGVVVVGTDGWAPVEAVGGSTRFGSCPSTLVESKPARITTTAIRVR